MLWITIPSSELFDERKNEFISIKETKIQLEHSLVSLSKWESFWKKPLLGKDSLKAPGAAIDYVRCMTITQNVNPNVYLGITDEIMDQINKYMDDEMTATTFPQGKKKGGREEIVTAELIYYWMIAYNIPFECQRWHINRLLTLIRVCSIKNSPEKKMSRSEILARNKALNEQRRAQYKTKG